MPFKSKAEGLSALGWPLVQLSPKVKELGICLTGWAQGPTTYRNEIQPRTELQSRDGAVRCVDSRRGTYSTLKDPERGNRIRHFVCGSPPAPQTDWMVPAHTERGSFSQSTDFHASFTMDRYLFTLKAGTSLSDY